MGNIFGILLIFTEVVIFLFAANRLAFFFINVWRKKVFEGKMIGQFIAAVVLFLLIFFAMKQYPEFFDFKVSEARSARKIQI